MKTRKLGNLTVSGIGMGCMGFSTGYGAIPEESESIRLIRKAYELECTLYDTAELYGTYRNEILVGKALAPIREHITLVTKYSPKLLPNQENYVDGKLSKQGVRQAVEDSLKRLNTEVIDLYLCHRVPREIDIRELADWFGALIRAGKIKGWGLSEASADEIRAAHEVTPITAVESEYSMMARQWEKTVVPLCRKLGIGFLAYAPMAGGFLSGKISTNTEYKGDDIRRTITRYQKDNIAANQPVLDLIKQYADEKNVSMAQISLAWVMHESHIVPIPGMRNDSRIAENLGAADVILSDDEYHNITAALDKLTIYGDRKDEDIAKLAQVRIELYGQSGMAIDK